MHLIGLKPLNITLYSTDDDFPPIALADKQITCLKLVTHLEIEQSMKLIHSDRIGAEIERKKSTYRFLKFGFLMSVCQAQILSYSTILMIKKDLELLKPCHMRN